MEGTSNGGANELRREKKARFSLFDCLYDCMSVLKGGCKMHWNRVVRHTVCWITVNLVQLPKVVSLSQSHRLLLFSLSLSKKTPPPSASSFSPFILLPPEKYPPSLLFEMCCLTERDAQYTQQQLSSRFLLTHSLLIENK